MTHGAENIIKIAGIGSFGSKIVNDILAELPFGAKCINMDTDWAALPQSVSRFIKLGPRSTNGLGAGALAHIGARAAEECELEIAASFNGCSLLFLVAGLGGGTGSGASPKVAQIAKQLNIPVIAFVLLPPEIEGKIRRGNAEGALEKLKGQVDVLFALPVQELVGSSNERRGVEQAFRDAEQSLKTELLRVVKLARSMPEACSPQEFLHLLDCRAPHVQKFFRKA